MRRGHPEELVDRIDGALLVDLGDELTIPLAIRKAWQPAVEIAGNGPRERPRYAAGSLPVSLSSAHAPAGPHLHRS
jgi:hypothetical protein